MGIWVLTHKPSRTRQVLKLDANGIPIKARASTPETCASVPRLITLVDELGNPSILADQVVGTYLARRIAQPIKASLVASDRCVEYNKIDRVARKTRLVVVAWSGDDVHWLVCCIEV